MLKRGLYLFVAVLLVLSGRASAQDSTGGIRGIIRDDSGAILAGVTVEAASPSRIGAPAVDVSNEQGLYRFDNLALGTYTVTFTLQGFSTLRREDVRVEVSRSIEVPATLAVGAVEQSVTVTGDSPVVDTVHAGYATSFGKALLENIPTARTSWFDTIGFAPAVKTSQVAGNSATFVMYGTSSEQNSYQVNGVEVSSASGVVWDFPNPDYFEEVAVVGIGASAEYSGFQGGVVNIVTKSGSNQFRGVGSFYTSSDALVASNGFPDATRPFPYYVDYQYDAGLQLGGPIKRDRVWFYGTLPAIWRRGSNIGVDPVFATATHAVRPYGKINAKPTAKDNLEFSWNDNIFDSPNSASITTPLQTTTTEHGHNPVLTARWNRTLGTATVLEVKGGGIYIRDRLDPFSDNFSVSGHTDTGTGIATTNATQAQRIHQNRTSIDAAVSHNADNFLGGSHDIKAGGQFSDALQENNVTVFQNVSYADFNGAPDQATFRDPRSTGGRVRAIGGFAQDNWTLTDRITANLGVRYDHTTGSIPEFSQYDGEARKPTDVTFDGLGTLITFDNVSPRVGLTYKLDQSGKTVAKASYGRYYGRLPVGLFANLAPGNTTTSVYRYNPVTAKYDNLVSVTDPNANLAIDPDLKNQSTDQFYVGVERQIAPDFGVNASFVYKKDHDQIRGFDPRSVYTPTAITETFNGVSQSLTVYNRTSPASQVLQQATNRPDFDQDYKSFIIQGSKRFANRWQVQSSYQWQRSQGISGGGTTVDSQQGVTGTFGADPNQLVNAYGRFITDSTHSVKISATTELPYAFHLGIRESFESGRPYGRLITVRGLAQGTVNVLAEPRGSYQLPSTNDLQVRVDKDFRFNTSQRLRLSVDFLNIFNVDTPIDIQNNSSQTLPFGTTLGIFLPRRALLAVRYEF